MGKGKKKYNKLNEYTNRCMPEIRSFECDQLKGNFSNAPNVTTCSKPTTSVYFFSQKTYTLSGFLWLFCFAKKRLLYMYVFHRSNQHHDYMKQKVTSNNKIVILPLVFNMYINLKKINFYDSYRSR